MRVRHTLSVPKIGERVNTSSKARGTDTWLIILDHSPPPYCAGPPFFFVLPPWAWAGLVDRTITCESFEIVAGCSGARGDRLVPHPVKRETPAMTIIAQSVRKVVRERVMVFLLGSV